MLRAATVGALALLASLASTGASAAPAQATKAVDPPACQAGRRAQIGRELQAILDKATARGAPHAAVLRVQCGRQVWSLASGVADVQSGRAARPDDRFRAGSIVKPTIAAVVLQLAEEGKLSLDDPITRRLPARYTAGFKDADAITVRMLLNHHSGIGEWTESKNLQALLLSDIHRVWTPDEYIAMAVERGPKFKPGTTFAYSNTGYILLGQIIEEATGRPWRESVLKRVLRPVGASAAALPPHGAPPDLRRYMHGYTTVEGREIDVAGVDPSMGGSAGGLRSTTEELARFMSALTEGRYFKRAETLAQMMDFGPSQNVPVTGGGSFTGYGLGLVRYRFPDGAVGFGHTGGTAGYTSFVFRIPELDVTISGAQGDDSSDAMRVFGAEAARLIIAEARR